MAIKMTRAEYEAKYGTSNAPATPVKMTRAEYEAKYSKSPSFLEKAAQFIAPSTTNLVKDIASSYSVNKQIPQVNATSDESLRLAKLAIDEKDPVKKQELLAKYRQLGEQKVDTSGFSKDVEKNYANRAVGVAGEIGSFLVPEVKAFKGVTAGQRIANMALTGATSGAIRGGTTPVDDLESRAKNLAEGTIVGGLAGAATQGVFESAAMVKNAFSKATGKVKSGLVDLYKSTLKQNIRDENAIAQAGGIDKVVDDSIRLDIPNTQRGIESELSKALPEYNRKVVSEAARAENAGKTINIRKAYESAKNTVLKKLKDEPEQLSGAQKWFEARDKMFLNKANEAAKPLSANKLRIAQDKTTGALITSDIQVGGKLARKEFATELRRAFKDTVPSLNNDTRRIELLYKMADAFKIEPMPGITEVGGALAGAATSGNPLSALLGWGATKIVRSPGVRRAVAKQGIKTLTGAPKMVTAQTAPTAAASAGSLVDALIRYQQNSAGR